MSIIKIAMLIVMELNWLLDNWLNRYFTTIFIFGIVKKEMCLFSCVSY